MVLLRQRGDVANDGLGFAQSKHDLETHRPPKWGWIAVYATHYGEARGYLPVHRKHDEDSNLEHLS